MSRDEINEADAKRIAQDAKIARDYLEAILTETRSGYVSRRYIREKITNVAYAVDFIKGVAERGGENG